jgi:hypothetical protein
MTADWWLIGLTGALVLVGIIQIIVFMLQLTAFRNQARRLKETIDVMKDNAVRELRAYVHITGGCSVFHEGNAIRGRLRIKNSGKTPAFKLTISAFTHRAEFPLPPGGTATLFREAKETGTEIPRAGAAALGAGNVQQVEDDIVADLTPKQRDSLNADDIAFYVYGEITYDDVFGHQRQTMYCLFIRGRDAVSGGGSLGQYGEGNEAT